MYFVHSNIVPDKLGLKNKFYLVNQTFEAVDFQIKNTVYTKLIEEGLPEN